MDPVTGALLGGVVNSLFAPKPKYVVPDYQAIRNKAEKAGFNPLTALTQGPQGSVVQGQNYMGAAISDALLIAAGDKEKDARISLLEAQTANYKKSVENMTLRPKVGGIYSQGKSGGSNDRLDNQGDGVSVSNKAADNPSSPKLVNTFSTYTNNGAFIDVPLGPDPEEIASGWFISELNKSKAKAEFRRDNSKTMTFGVPLAVPFGITNRVDEIMPPSSSTMPPDKSARWKKAWSSWPAGVPMFGYGF